MQPVKCFYSYSHADKGFRETLSNYLAPLRQQKKITEWYDRNIEPGKKWDQEISDQIDSVDLIFFLITAEFLASDYCFGVEVEKAFKRLKNKEVRIVPILIKPCLWDQSRFSELQMIPRDAKPVTLSTSADNAFFEVAAEIKNIVNDLIAQPEKTDTSKNIYKFDHSLDLVRTQINSYAGLYERVRQQMQPGNDRTIRMQEVFEKMKKLSFAAYPFLDELQKSPLPGEHLMAVAILHEFCNEGYFDYLTDLIGAEKPFVGYQAAMALRIAAASVHPRSYDKLYAAVQQAKINLDKAEAGIDSDRRKILIDTETELQRNMAAFSTK
ncbi:MAG: toll/interleukin-1 receptor domain-containing protein [Bacteroidota bacterium]